MSPFILNLHRPQPSQLSSILELDRRCLGGIWSLLGYQRELASPNTSFIALSTSERIMGCGCFWSILEEAHITLLMIHPDYQGQGLGQLLLCALLQDAVGRQLERATLEVRVSNQVALNLYQKFGFKVAGRRKGYYPTTGEDALILWRGDLHLPQFQEELLNWQLNIKDKLIAHHWHINSSQLLAISYQL